MSRIKTIIFDAGGTLIYPNDPVGDTYARIARKYGVKLNPDTTNDAFIAAKNSSTRKGEVPNNGQDRTFWLEIVKKSVAETQFSDKAKYEKFFNEVYDFYGQPEAWGVFPEVPEVLEELQDRGLDLVVMSNWDARLHPVLDGLGLGEYFPKRFISAEIGWEKPDPAIYRHVADLLRSEGADLLSVGDDSKNDVDGPKKAGWRAVHLERPKSDLWVVTKALSRR